MHGVEWLKRGVAGEVGVGGVRVLEGGSNLPSKYGSETDGSQN